MSPSFDLFSSLCALYNTILMHFEYKPCICIDMFKIIVYIMFPSMMNNPVLMKLTKSKKMLFQTYNKLEKKSIQTLRII